jgi:hypothetical protein
VMMLGIDRMGSLIYEGESPTEGHPVWPHPVVSLAHRILSMELPNNAEAKSDQSGGTLETAQLVFREDTFDSVSRVRRGRLYYRCESRTIPWSVTKHPAAIHDTGYQRKDLHSFQARPPDGTDPALHNAKFALGSGLLGSHWRVVDLERIASGEDLVTLKALSRFGVLPELDASKIPGHAKEPIVEFYDKAADAAYRFGPESVIDRCRESASALIGAWLVVRTGDATQGHLDLGKASEAVGLQEKKVACSAGQLLGLLHVRGKSSEQAKRRLSAPTDADATIALECLGLIARELGYAFI